MANTPLVYARSSGLIGSLRIRLPVALKMALVTAGAIGGVLASPMPPGIRARHDVGFDHRHLVDSQRFVVVEVLLLHAAAIDRDVAAQRGAQAVNDAALDLLHHDRRIDDMPAIDGANHAMDSDLSLVDRNLGDLRVEAADVVDDRDAAMPSGRQRLCPSRPSLPPVPARPASAELSPAACGGTPPDPASPRRPSHR